MARRHRHSATVVGTAALGLAVVLSGALPSARQAGGERPWIGYGGSAESSRFFANSQINKENVQRLAVAWTYPYSDTLATPIMARGVVYRSGRLTDLSASDRRELAAAGITDIYDLRTTKVARRSPDRSVKGADYHLVNLFGVYSTPSKTFRSISAARADRKRINREFVSDAEQRRRTAKVLTAIARADGPVIIHCTEGKDRTGWVSAVLQLTAGASRKDVVAEYVLSNSYRKDEIAKRYAKVLRARGKRAAKIDRVAYVVEGAFLKAGLAELDKRYGSVDAYLSKGLKLSPSTIAALRDRLRA